MDFKNLLNFAVGLAALIPFAIFVLLSLPIYIYRWIITNVAAPKLRPELGGALSPLSSGFGSEFILENFHSRPSRCSVVSRGFFNGRISSSRIKPNIEKDLFYSTIITKSGTEALRYPELRQYITSWMGFLFWRKDENFLFENHVKFHEISRFNANPEEFLQNLTEELLNKPFPKNRSPWEGHIVRGYRNDKIFPRKVRAHEEEDTGDGEMTIWMFRWHHALADGISSLSLQLEGLLGLSMDKEFEMLSRKPKGIARRPMSEKVVSLLHFPLNLAMDAASIIKLIFQSTTPFHSHDSSKEWKQIYGNTPFIPVNDIRTVKDAFGVSFTSVLFSCISAVLSKNLMKKGHKSGLEFLPVSTALPLARSPEQRYKLTNRFTGSAFNLPVRSNLDPVKRLRASENCFQQAKRSTLPLLFYGCSHAAGFHFPAISNAIVYNRMISVGLSNFPGTSVGERAHWLGHMVLGTDVALGGLQGVAGISFMAFSTENYVRVSLTAEASVINRKEMDEIVDGIHAELDYLLKLARHK